jgi:hypothetical protein
MKPLIGRALRRAGFWLPVVALLTFGTSTAAMAAQAAPKPAKFTWHGFKLLNGWKSASSKTSPTGTPGWALHDGVIYLRGAVTQPESGGSPTFAQLPKFAEPTRNLYLEVSTYNSTPGIVYIGSTGALQAYDGSAFEFTSLSGLSYPASTVKSHKLTLTNGWLSEQGDWGTGDPAYAVSDGVVYLSGSLHDGTIPLAFTLPKAARPARELYILVYTQDGSPGWLTIKPSGAVTADGSSASEFTSLAGVSFPVASTNWHKFALIDDWVSGYGTYHSASPEYTVINGVVYLNGSISQTSVSSSAWTNLPAAAKPADRILIQTAVANSSSGTIALTNPQAEIFSTPYSTSEQFTSLAGIAYPSSS